MGKDHYVEIRERKKHRKRSRSRSSSKYEKVLTKSKREYSRSPRRKRQQVRDSSPQNMKSSKRGDGSENISRNHNPEDFPKIPYRPKATFQVEENKDRKKAKPNPET